MRVRPASDEYASAFQAYVGRVPDGDVQEQLRAQGERSRVLFAGIGEAKGGFRYAPGKWTVKRVLQHVTDGERLFCYRALCIARGEQGSLPGFDENLYAEQDGSDARRLTDIVSEFASVREATLTLFAGFDEATRQRRGTANGNPVSVRALAWIIAGHELHHLAVLRERYGITA
jgi:hypothetical protein